MQSDAPTSGGPPKDPYRGYFGVIDRGYIGVLLGLYIGVISGLYGIMEKKMETIIMGFYRV